MNEDMIEDKWDYVHITTWNFLPFILKRVGQAPTWVVEALTAVWLTLLTVLISLLGFANRLVAKRQFDLAGRSSC
jgi:hypothetical protein